MSTGDGLMGLQQPKMQWGMGVASGIKLSVGRGRVQLHRACGFREWDGLSMPVIYGTTRDACALLHRSPDSSLRQRLHCSLASGRHSSANRVNSRRSRQTHTTAPVAPFVLCPTGLRQEQGRQGNASGELANCAFLDIGAKHVMRKQSDLCP